MVQNENNSDSTSHDPNNHSEKTIRYKPFPRVDSFESSPVVTDPTAPLLDDDDHYKANGRSFIPSNEHNSSPIIRRDRGCSSTSITSNEPRYEEFDKKLTVQCPTCQGKGKLTQSKKSSVALCSVRDSSKGLPKQLQLRLAG